MGVNFDKPTKWKPDIISSVDYYNSWFLEFAPATFRETRTKATVRVNDALDLTDNLTSLSVETLLEHPEILPILRMSTCPPLAQDRLSGLAGVSRNLINNMEDKENPRLPPRMPQKHLRDDLSKIVGIIHTMIDPDVFLWFDDYEGASSEDVWRAATVVADRLCGADANPIIRNAQEHRQLALVSRLLEQHGYVPASTSAGSAFEDLQPGEFSFRLNVPGKLEDGSTVNIPVDIVIKRKNDTPDAFPLLFEAKSAGDFANVNKRRKEEANKLANLRRAYGESTRLNLLLCGYFDTGYLGYAAAEGCDWVWEHRLSDLELFGI
ncbi:MAG: XamI family restriction endonuclease [Coriobacteriales bacterium]|nr:XamI family restriction endonuclease [Coriobacteriales bacterium]